MRIHAACCFVLALWLSVASLTHAGSEKNVSESLSRNDAEAAVRSDETKHQGDKPMVPTTAQPTNDCPDGYRLHYQGFCINMADELRDDPVKGVRGVAPNRYPK